MTGGSSNSNVGGNLVLISGTGSADGGVSSILGGSGGSGFGGSMTVVSSSSTGTSSLFQRATVEKGPCVKFSARTTT